MRSASTHAVPLRLFPVVPGRMSPALTVTDDEQPFSRKPNCPGPPLQPSWFACIVMSGVGNVPGMPPAASEYAQVEIVTGNVPVYPPRFPHFALADRVTTQGPTPSETVDVMVCVIETVVVPVPQDGVFASTAPLV